jgi:glucose/arabinose dehydrogenase
VVSHRSRGAVLRDAALVLVALVLAAGAGLYAFRGQLAGILPYPGAAGAADLALPPGFRIDVFAADVPGARSLALGPDGLVVVGTRDPGKVYAVRDADGDGRAEPAVVLAEGLDTPNGVAVRGDALYVGEVNRILRFDGLASPPRPLGRPTVVVADYPTERHHGWKFIAFGPDGKLYVPVGAPCNVCERADERYAAITRVAPDGSGREIVARGVRNTVGFDWQPGTGVLWFTDNGRDNLGDDVPPDELNRADRPGLHFGFPYCHGRGIRDPDLGGGRDCATTVPPARELGPHVAALGMRFYTGRMFPERYRGGIFIAEHGSWNRRTPIGYRVTFVGVEGDRATSYEVFAQGWLQGSVAAGRPVDVLVMPDGALLVSDDKGGRIYRVRWTGP